ncbi:electron transfer flavoprotein subunit alpha/FixB family protein [archaeon]|nr:electron transfer flavoprotein subunit alpha/FixB family protein [archaeon]
MSMPVHVIAHHNRGQILPETYETVAFAFAVSHEKPQIIVLGDRNRIGPLSEKLAADTGLDVTGLSGEFLEDYSAEAYTHALTSHLKGKGSLIVCIPQSSLGSDLAPQLSVRLGASCITSIETIQDGLFVRSMYNGRFRACHTPSASSMVLTVLPGAWKAGETMPSRPGRITVKNIKHELDSTRIHGIRSSIHVSTELTHAEVIISAGRGIGKKENLSNIMAMSGLFPKSAIGASRAVCDLGWLDYTHQVGSTGNKVCPRLYIACGISGAAQHVAGMKGSRLIIAINTDIHAAIFKIANYCITEDVNEFIPLLIDICRKDLMKN